MLITDMLPPDSERLRWERASRAYIQRIFSAVMEDRWDIAHGVYREAQAEGEWMCVATWAGLPATVRERLRSMESEDRGTQ